MKDVDGKEFNASREVNHFQSF